MKCSDVNKLINAFLDQQLDAANSLKVEQHLSGCTYCNTAYLELAALQKKVRHTMDYYSAPEDLKHSIYAQFDTETSTTPIASVKNRAFRGAISFAASLLITFTLVFAYIQHQRDEELVDEVLAEHIRAITAKRYADISSSKTEIIIPWFTSRLNFSPKIFNFKDQGFTLAGGRLDSFQKQNIATVTYKINNKLINVYTWPSPDVDDAVQELHHRQGYHLLYWCQNKMNYWIVSDSSNQDVIKLAGLINTQLKTSDLK